MRNKVEIFPRDQQSIESLMEIMDEKNTMEYKKLVG